LFDAPSVDKFLDVARVRGAGVIALALYNGGSRAGLRIGFKPPQSAIPRKCSDKLLDYIESCE